MQMKKIDKVMSQSLPTPVKLVLLVMALKADKDGFGRLEMAYLQDGLGRVQRETVVGYLAHLRTYGYVTFSERLDPAIDYAIQWGDQS